MAWHTKNFLAIRSHVCGRCVCFYYSIKTFMKQIVGIFASLLQRFKKKKTPNDVLILKAHLKFCIISVMTKVRAHNI